MNRRILIALASILLIGLTVVAARLQPSAWARSSSDTGWSAADAKQYLDTRGQWWLGWNGSARGSGTACLSCHTSMPIALAQAALVRQIDEQNGAAIQATLIGGVTHRVASWPTIVSSAPPAGDTCVCDYSNMRPASLGTESVLNALVLVDNDRVASHTSLSTASQTALNYLWDEQQSDGSWQWLDFGLSPWEHDGVYYGTALAAIAVGMAGHSYYDRPNLHDNIASMRGYLQAQYASRPLHDQTVCLWASTWLPGILTAGQKAALVDELFGVQQADGGWSLPSLGVRNSGQSQWTSGGTYPAGSVSDGYATGLVVLALKRAGVPESDAHLQRGIAWLQDNEKSGSWPANYINGARDPQSDTGGFMRDASTSFAVLALTEPAKR